MNRKVCTSCNRKFSNMNLHISMSRCGRLQRGKLNANDLNMIDKLGTDRAIRRIEP